MHSVIYMQPRPVVASTKGFSACSPPATLSIIAVQSRFACRGGAASSSSPALNIHSCATFTQRGGARHELRQGHHIVAQALLGSNTVSVPKAATPKPPYNAVITGSTKGIGRALAVEFLRAGDRVVICSRSEERVNMAVKELAAEFGSENVRGFAADVARPGQARLLADFAFSELGRVDLWINNAGTNGYRYGPMAESTDEELQQIVGTNVLGVMLCCKEAIRVMKGQGSHGHIFNMDGAGSDGNATPRFAAYGATKRSLAQLGKSLSAELGILGIRNVAVHNLSPGMVTTELLMSGANNPTAKFFINCLAEPAEDVAAYLVPRIRTVPQSAVNPMTGSLSPTYIRFLTQPKALRQVAARLLTGARKGRYVPEDDV